MQRLLMKTLSFQAETMSHSLDCEVDTAANWLHIATSSIHLQILFVADVTCGTAHLDY